MLGENIKKYREDKYYSQNDLADLMGVSVRTVNRWESNSTNPRVGDLPKLAEILGVTEGELLGNTDKSTFMTDTLETLSEDVSNIVTNMDAIKKTVASGQEESRARQDELIEAFQKQKEEVKEQLDKNRRDYSLEKELLVQKKIKNGIFIGLALIIITLVILFLLYLINFGTDPNVILNGPVEVYEDS